MNKKLFGFFIIIILSFYFIISSVVSQGIGYSNLHLIDENSSIIKININPPNPPNIEGSSNCKIWTEYQYNFTLSHIDDIRLISLYVSFGDGINITKNYKGTSCLKGWPSGHMISIRHKWIKSGDYSIKAKVKDYIGIWSDWGELDIFVFKKDNSNDYESYMFRLIERLPILELFL